MKMIVRVEKLILNTSRRLYLAGNESESFFLVSDQELDLKVYEMNLRYINYRYNYYYLIELGDIQSIDLFINPMNISLIENELIY